MASEGTELSTRMSTEDQGRDNRFTYDIRFQHFKRNKVEISRAINKEFPFLQILRDRKLITNKMYEDCQESCRNLVPVQRVVYNVLEELEKTFDLSLLDVLFSEDNKQEYPALNNISKGFENENPESICFQENYGEESVENPNTQLSLEQGTGENSYQSLTWICSHPANYNGTSPPENGLSEHHRERGQINVNETVTTSNNNDALESQQVNEQGAQETESAESYEQVPIQGNNGNARLEMPSPLPSDEEMISSDEDESPKASTSEQRRRPGAELQGLGNQKCSCVVCSPSVVPRGQEARSECSQASDMMGKKRRNKSKKTSPQKVRSRGRDRMQSLNNRVPRKRSKPKGTKAVNTRPLKRSRGRGPRIPRDKHKNFERSILPVTCGPAKGMLYKQKMKQGISAKCIKTKNGKQLTLKEFEIEGNYERAKNWRLSVRCGGYTLKDLIENGFLTDPPRTRKAITA